MWYVDAGLFLALLKDEDRLKVGAQKFISVYKGQSLFTSTTACLEVWFYLYNRGKQTHALDALRAISSICAIRECNLFDMESAVVLAGRFQLSPADAVHAAIARTADGIVSSDAAFDRIPGLKRLDFSRP